MLTVTRREFCGSALALAATGCCAVRGGAKRWYKGMLHCHSYWSDGRAFPEQGAKAYYDHGYHFYCMSDHNRLGKNPDYWRNVCEDEGNWPKNVYRPIFESYRRTFPDAEIRERNGKTQVRIKTFDEIKAKFDQPGRFLVLPGMELTRTAGEQHVEAAYTLQDDDLYVRAIAESSEPVTGYAKTSHQHPQHKLAWTQPLRKGV